MTIRPSSRSNGTGPARGDSRAGVTEVSGRRPGAGSSALEQTGEGAAPTRRRRAVRYDRQRPGHQQGADSATPAPQGAGSFYGRGGTRRRPAGQGSHPFSGPGEPVGDPWDGAAASGRPQPHLNTPHHNHKAPHPNRANHSPRLPGGERSPVGRDAPGERSASGRVGHVGHLGYLGYLGTPGISGTSGASGASEPRGGRGARGTSGREVLERSKRSRGDLRKTL